VDCNPKADKPQ